MIGFARVCFQSGACSLLCLLLSSTAGAAPSNVAAWSQIGLFQQQLGMGAGTAGDFNCDGVSDLLVSAPYSDYRANGEYLGFSTADWGWLAVYYGDSVLPPQPSGTPDWVVVGQDVVPLQNNQWLGAAIAAGDVNRDGCDDVIATTLAPTSVRIYFGSPSGPSSAWGWRRSGFPADSIPTSNLAYYSTSLATGDVNGDGTADIILGLPEYDNGQLDEGAVYVWLGSQFITNVPDGPVDPVWIAQSNQADAHLGVSVASWGDVDRDGDDEVLVGAPDWDAPGPIANAGIALLWKGSPVFESTADGTPANASWSIGFGSAGDRYGASVAFAGDVDGDGFSDILVGAPDYDNPFVTGTREGLVLVTRGATNGPAVDAYSWFHPGQVNLGALGTSVATAGDVNGDGRADYLMGEPEAQLALNLRGRVHLVLGRPSNEWGINPVSDVIYTETGTGNTSTDSARYGSVVATAGDWNDDGFSDIVVGARTKGYPNSIGQVFVYRGRGETIASAPVFTSRVNQASATLGVGLGFAGDINHDGYTDYVAGAPLYESTGAEADEGRFFVTYGGSCGPACGPAELILPGDRESNQAGAQLGYNATGAGDVNGDGYADVIVGAPLYDTTYLCSFSPITFCPRPNVGLARLYLGGSGGLSLSHNLDLFGDNQQDAQFGFSVASAGDVNGDGYGDVIVGAPFANAGLVNQGRAFLYLGSASGLSSTPNWTKSGTQVNARFGTDAASAGDVNGDGYGDVIIGADGHGGTGAAYVYLGQPTTPAYPTGLASTPIRTYFGSQIGSTFGVAVAGAGDVNRDGFSDIVIGDPTFLDDPDFGPQIGKVNVYHGSANGPGANPAREIYGSYSQYGATRFGSGVAGAGDVNGDGYGDLIVGDQWGEGPAGFAQGRADVFHGSATGIAALSSRVLQDCATDFCDFGRDVAGGGDVNGDGFADVLVGGYLHTDTLLNQGGVFVHLGNEGRGTAIRPLQALGFGGAPRALLGITPNWFEASLDLKSPAGRTDVELEVEVEPLGVDFDGLGTQTSVFLDNFPAGSTTRDVINVFGNPGGVYHWRARMRSASPLFGRSRWVSLPENAPRETDIRVVPEPGLISGLVVGIGALITLERRRRRVPARGRESSGPPAPRD